MKFYQNILKIILSHFSITRSMMSMGCILLSVLWIMPFGCAQIQEDIAREYTKCEVPNVKNKNGDDAAMLIKQAGLRVGELHGDGPVVLKQMPDPWQEAACSIYVSLWFELPPTSMPQPTTPTTPPEPPEPPIVSVKPVFPTQPAPPTQQSAPVVIGTIHAPSAGMIEIALIAKEIDAKHAAFGWLGNSKTQATRCPDGKGYYQHFEYGVIYWYPQTGAYEVHGDILKKWAELGYENSVLGYPLTDETPTPDGVGRFSHFQSGSIYWTPQTDAHEVHGDIYKKWESLGWERSFLGYPLTDERDLPNGAGRYNNFQGGSIRWSPQNGAIPSNEQVGVFHF